MMYGHVVAGVELRFCQLRTERPDDAVDLHAERCPSGRGPAARGVP